MILVIDNYDSFTYNLVQYIGQIEPNLLIKRNDEITLDEIEKINPTKIVISPGPCTPREAGISIELIKKTKVRRIFYQIIKNIIRRCIFLDVCLFSSEKVVICTCQDDNQSRLVSDNVLHETQQCRKSLYTVG